MTGNSIRLQPEVQHVPSRAAYKVQPWHAAYLAALFETNRAQLKNRIQDAEQSILRRERELFATAADSSEQSALNNALHALRALRACLGC